MGRAKSVGFEIDDHEGFLDYIFDKRLVTELPIDLFEHVVKILAVPNKKFLPRRTGLLLVKAFSAHQL
jgi:hypothetical protein